MPMTSHAPARLLVLVLLLALPAGAQSQRRPAPPPPGSSPGWTPAMLGFRFGYEDRSNASVVGAQLRVPILPSGIVEVVPNGDITFLRGLKEYQWGADATWVSSGRRGGLYAGVGAIWRNSIYADSTTTRETRGGWDVVVGLKTMPGGSLPVGIQLEERFVFVNVPFKPRVLSFGVNFPLWGWGRRSGSGYGG
jgi:hypothetical protein